MNTQSTACPKLLVDSQVNGSQISQSRASATAVLTAMRPFYWSVRRELWENRSIYIAPLAVAAVLFGFLIASMGHALSTTDMAQRRAALEEPYTFAMGVIMGTAFIVSIFLLARRATRRASRPQHPVLEVAAGFRPHHCALEGEHSASSFCRCSPSRSSLPRN